MASPRPFQPLRGVRIVSLALNLPGPAALMRLHALGARCLKVEPPGRSRATRWASTTSAPTTRCTKACAR